MAIEILETIKKYFAFILLFSIPFYAVTSFLIYDKSRLNFTEYLILNCHALGVTLFVGTPLNLLLLLDESLFVYSIINLSLLYCVVPLFTKGFTKRIIL
ncbi:MAG: hypothetical protein ACJA1Z_002923 [Patiriisocius sp.]